MRSVSRSFFLIALLFFTIFSYSQEDSGLKIEGVDIGNQLEEIQTEFETTRPMTESEILQELSKPGNEHLLEMLKRGEMPETTTESDLENTDVDEAKNADETETEADKENDDDDDKLKKVPTDKLFFDLQSYYESVKDYYGYNLFLNIDSESMFGSASTTADYTLTYGDELVLTLWGDAKMRERIIINDEGTVFIPHLDIVYLYGYTLTDAREELKRRLSQYFMTLNPKDGEPTTFIDLSLWKKHDIQVFCNGEFVIPGSYSLRPNATIISAILRARGIKARGTLRDIQLIRNGKVITSLDLYDYLTTGKNVSDVPLMNGDNIFVGQRKSTIHLKGEVLNPLIYELKADETLEDVIKYAGGILPTASIDRVKIERIEPLTKRKQAVVYTNVIDTLFASNKDGKLKVEPIQLFDHDIINVMAIPRILSGYAVIDGAVYRKGKFSYYEGMKVGDLISRSGGLLADAFTKKVELHRVNSDQSKTYISLNLDDQKDTNFKLTNMDSLRIYSKWEIKSKNVAIISGYIERPGFVYFSDSTRVSDLIFSRGSLEDEWRKNRTYMIRATLTRYNEDGFTTKIIDLDLDKVLAGDKTEDIMIQDGDHIRIFDVTVIRREGNVEITGMVRSEGNFKLSNNMTVEDVILKADGFLEDALKSKIFVYRRVREKNSERLISNRFEINIDPDFLLKKQYNKSDFILKDNDLIVVRKDPYTNSLRKVTISGEVVYPGSYALSGIDDSFASLIEAAGGLTEEAFIEGTKFLRDSINIVGDFSKTINKRNKYDILLKAGDTITIPKKPGTVYVDGFVYTPGFMKYREDWTLEDYINAAGGTLHEDLYVRGAPVVYYPGGNAKVDDGWFMSPTVKEGSRIFVPKKRREAERNWSQDIRTWLSIMTSTITVIVLIDAVYK